MFAVRVCEEGWCGWLRLEGGGWGVCAGGLWLDVVALVAWMLHQGVVAR